MKNVLIVYHYIAHYRIPIFNLLSKSVIPQYTILSGTKTDIKIKTADTKLADISPENGGIKWLIIKNIWLLKYFLIQFSAIKYSLIKKYDTIIFLGNMYYISTWIGAIVARLTGKKVIFWTHGFIRDEKNIQGFFRSLFYKLANEILVYGQRAKDILISKGFSEDKIKLIYNSLDYDEQIAIRKKYSNTPKLKLFKHQDLPCFGFIGRLTEQKKVSVLLDALYNINKDSHKANLLLIGSGEQMEPLKEIVKELKLEDYVVFYGACYDEKVIYKLMKSVKIIVSPGEVGLTAIHALTYGVPVLTHDRFDKQMPEFEVVIKDKTGGFYEYNNLESLSKLILKWLYEKDKNEVEKDCYKVIDDYYNPYVQKTIFDSVV